MNTDGDEAKYPCRSVFIRGLNHQEGRETAVSAKPSYPAFLNITLPGNDADEK
jgi:hypothetical protein